MSLELWYENNNGDMVLASNRVKAGTLEVTISAEEASSSESQIIIDDPDGTFYIRGLKPLYLVETEAADDDWAGVIGIFYAWNRTFRRGPYSTGAGREVVLHVRDINTLLTRRLQKGSDAKRPQENDTTRMQWLIDTPEIIGGGSFEIEERTHFYTDSPVPMSETDYNGQDSAGVINDALQDSGKNAFLYNASTEAEPIRVGIWYGRTERADYASPHSISNDLADVDPETLSYFTDDPVDLEEGAYTFTPSRDTELDRDPSRVASGVMVQYDGGYAYDKRLSTAAAFEARDMLMQAELVKTQAQAIQRVGRYLRDLRNEDDAITCAVLVPAKLVNGFKEGQRVAYRSTYQPGYSGDPVQLRIARRTVRQIAGKHVIYELALDLRAEEPPDSATTGTGSGSGPASCIDDNGGTTPSQSFPPLGGEVIEPHGGLPNPSDGHVVYWCPGLPEPRTVEAATGFVGGWFFPRWSRDGLDVSQSCVQSHVRVLVVGDGTMTLHTEQISGSTFLTVTVVHHQYSGTVVDPTSGVDVIDSITTHHPVGTDIEVDVSTHDGMNCTHWVDITDEGGSWDACAALWAFAGADWVLAS